MSSPLLLAATPEAPWRWLSEEYPLTRLDECLRQLETFAEERHKVLFPLLGWTRLQHGDTRTFWKAAYFREQLRAQAFRRAVEETGELLQHAGVRWVATGAAALCAQAYPDAGLRHAPWIEVLVASQAERRRFATAAQAAGWTDGRHPRGVTVRCLTSWPEPFSTPFAEVWRSSLAHPWCPSGRILSLSDQLVETLVRAFGPGDDMFPWEIDAAVLGRAGAVDYASLTARSRQNGSSALLAAGCQALGWSPLPYRWTWRSLQIAAWHARRRHGGFRNVFPRIPGIAQRLALASALCFPSQAVQRWLRLRGLSRAEVQKAVSAGGWQALRNFTRA